MTAYQDCNGSSISQNDIKVTPSCGSSFTVKTSYSSYQDITPVCKKSCSRCGGGSCSFPFGISRTIGTAVFSLKGYKCSDYVFSWSGCCWPNPKDPTNPTNLYLQATLNTSKKGNHSSPVFKSPPFLFTCISQCVATDQSGTDNFADSVSYELHEIYTDPSTKFNYTSGKTYLQPIAITGTDPASAFSPPSCYGFHYTSDGLLEFKPPKADYGYLSFSIGQWSKDSAGHFVKIGEINRVNTLYAIDCGSGTTCDFPPCQAGTKPVIGNINETGTTSIHICAGTKSQFTISIKSTGLDSLIAVSNMPGTAITYTNRNSKNATVTVNWAPDGTRVKSKPYILTVFATNGTCPLPQQFSKNFQVYVHDSFPKVKLSKSDSGCARYVYAAKNDTSYHLKYSWVADTKLISTLQSTTYTWPYNGKHVMDLTMTNAVGCTAHIYDSVSIHFLPVVITNADSQICPGKSVHISATGGIKYHWTPSSGLSSDTISGPIATPSATTTYFVSGTDKKDCKAIDSVKLTVDDFPIALNRDTGICFGQTIHLKAFTYKAFSYKWTNLAGKTISDSAVLVVKPDSDLIYFITIQDSFGCSKTIKGIIRVHHAKGNAGKDVSTCFGDSVQLHASGGGIYNWNLTQGMNNGFDKANPFVRPSHKQNYIVNITDTNGCYKTDTVTVYVSNIHANTSGQETICNGDSVRISASGGTNYSWFPQKGLNNPSVAFPWSSPSNTTTYIVTVCDSLCGCIKKDSVIITVKPFVKGHAGHDTSICKSSVIQIGTDSLPGYTYSWTSNPSGFTSTHSRINVKPGTSTMYYLKTVETGNNCSNIDSVTIKITAPSIPYFSGPVTTCQYDTVFYAIDSFKASYQYSWQILGGHILSKNQSMIFLAWDSAGANRIQLKSAIGNICFDSTLLQVNTINPPALKIKMPENICLGTAVYFRDSFKLAARYFWDFGSGDTTSMKEPTRVFTKKGGYKIKLTGYNSGCSNTAFDSLFVHPNPLISPKISRIGFRTFNFSNTDSLGTNYSWNFGDGDSAKNATIPHEYAKNGIYNTQYRISNQWGCSAYFDSILTVNDQDKIKYTDSFYYSPNPFTDDFAFYYTIGSTEEIKIVIFDALGRQITGLFNETLTPGQYTYQINASHFKLSQGIYFLKYSAGNKSYTLKIIKI